MRGLGYTIFFDWTGIPFKKEAAAILVFPCVFGLCPRCGDGRSSEQGSESCGADGDNFNHHLGLSSRIFGGNLSPVSANRHVAWRLEPAFGPLFMACSWCP